MQNQHKPIHIFPNLVVLDAIYPASDATPLHEDRWSRVSVVLKGKLKETACRKEEIAQVGSMVLKPGDMLHTNTFGTPVTRIISVALRPGYLARMLGKGIDDWQWRHNWPSAKVALGFAQQVIKTESEEEVLENLIELFASLAEKEVDSDKFIPPWVKWVAEHIADEYDQPLQTRQLAEAVGAHPVYLARVFRRAFGCSVKTYLQQQRVERVVQDISEGGKPLSQVAFDHGFADQSHLNRVFKQHLSFSPGAFRKWIDSY